MKMALECHLCSFNEDRLKKKRKIKKHKGGRSGFELEISHSMPRSAIAQAKLPLVVCFVPLPQRGIP